METVHSWLLMAALTDPWVSILKWGTTMCQFSVNKWTVWTSLYEGLLSFSEPGTAGCRTREKSHCWPSLWLPWPAGHPLPAGDPCSCSWPGSWCTDGWAEVVEEKLCPPCPRQCWWLDRSPADFSTVGQSLPGEPPPVPSQPCPAEEAAAAVLAFLRCPGKGRLRATLPAPARKDWSWDTVLWRVVVDGEPKRSNTEVLACWFFLVEEVFFVLVWLLSLGFWMNITDEPAILSACRMVRTQFWRTLGSGPRTWGPSKGTVLTVLRTRGWKPKFLSRTSRRNSCRLEAAAKPADTAKTWASCMIPCSTQVRSGASRCAPKAHLGYPWSAPNAPRCTHAPKAHLQGRSRCAPKAHQMDLNKIVRTKSAPIWLSHFYSAPNPHLKKLTFFYNARGAHQMDLNKIVCTKSAPI